MIPTQVNWHDAWLAFRPPEDARVRAVWARIASHCEVLAQGEYADAARAALSAGLAWARSAVPGADALSVDYPYSRVVLRAVGAPTDGDRIRVRPGHSDDTLLLEASSEHLLPFAAYWLLRHLQRGCLPPGPGTVIESPVQLRAISQWDNLDRTIERGYAGESFFDWSDPTRFAARQTAYAQLLCAAGINTLFLNNVNASPEVLNEHNLNSLRVFADRLRPWGIRVGIAVNFATPVALGELETADPLAAAVQAWWCEKSDQIYELVPDLAGFLVKANSEGQPGPQDYDRGHDDGANMLARAVAPHGGTVFWRAFVYRWNPSGRPAGDGHDSLHDSYHTFTPLDGTFDENVVVVIKNGPIDFQVREPIHPLFSAMTRSRCLLEFQITQEYTGQDVHVCFLPVQWSHYLDEPLDEVTRLRQMVRGEAAPREREPNARFAGMLGVSAWGESDCWSGHPLAQANLYGFGRLAWDPETAPEVIARDWTAQTLGTNERTLHTVVKMLVESWEIYESYTSPFGLGMMHCKAKHLDPAPEERTSVHQADETGIGRDRTRASGSGFTDQYGEPLRSRYEALDPLDESLLLMFHRVPWDYTLSSGLTVWQALEALYRSGLAGVADMQRAWDELVDLIDSETHRDISARLQAQMAHARMWARTMLEYFEGRRK